MADLIVLVPSRGRPEAARELVQAFKDTCTANTLLCFVVDEDDPTRLEYMAITGPSVGIALTPSHNMVQALNFASVTLAKDDSAPFAFGFMGDDHRPRTLGWDAKYLDTLRSMGTGIVYGDDLFQGEQLPTQAAMTTDIIQALGYMAPPDLVHMYVDNFWRDLGRAVGCLRYLPDVVVEHMHPVAGKADWDEGHARVNDQSVYAADAKTYHTYRGTEFLADVAKVQALVGHEWRLFPEGTIPEYTKPEWYEVREHAPHLEQAGHRDRLMATASLVAQAAMYGHRTLVDLGSGDGGLLSLLGPAIKAWGYDLMPENLDAAKDRGVDVRFGDVVEGDIDWGQIAVATEMLEHLVDPHAFVRRIAEHCQVLVCSSPWLERPGSAYEFHTWCFDLEGYRNLVEQAGFVVKRQQRVHGFQIILAVKP
jgi:hypothetical protein